MCHFIRTPRSIVAITCLEIGLLFGAVSSGARPPASGGGGSPQPPDPAIAFSSGGVLSVMNTDGSNLVSIVGNSYVSRPPSWSPDGTSLAFRNWEDTSFSGNGVYIVGLDDRDVIPAILDSETHIASHPSWSPAGEPIAYLWYEPLVSATSFDEIRAVRADGTDELLFQFSPPWFVLGGLSWAPEGTRLSVVILDEPTGDRFVGVVDLMTGSIADVTPEFTWIQGDSANWARTGDALAIVGQKAGDDDKAIWIIDLTEPPGSSVRLRKVLSASKNGGGLLSPSWSPDDSRLVFGRFDTRTKTGVWLLDLGTGTETLLCKTSLPWPDWRRF